MDSNEAVRLFEQTGALLTGHFELRSGLHSDRYFQCAMMLQHPVHTAALCQGLVAQLKQSGLALDGVSVISPAMGGILVGHEVGRALRARSIFVEKDPEGKLVLRRGFRINPGDAFVVAEDVVTRGGRVQETIDIVEARGGVVKAIAVLVDRSGGKASFSAPVFSMVRMEPVTWAPAQCPLCKQGVAIEHPGS